MNQKEAYDDLVETLLVNDEAIIADLKVGSHFDTREHAGLHVVEDDAIWKNFLTIRPHFTELGAYGPTLLVQVRVTAINHFKGTPGAKSWDNPGRADCRVVWIDEQDTVQFVWHGNYMVVIAQAMDQLAIDEGVE